MLSRQTATGDDRVGIMTTVFFCTIPHDMNMFCCFVNYLENESLPTQVEKVEINQNWNILSRYGPLASNVNLRVEHAPRMRKTFLPPPLVSDPDMHHGTCVTHVPWCMPGPLTSGFLWSRWQGKRPRHSRRMHNPQSCLSGKRLMLC